ncbi:MAG: DUF938 domain-containing protein [Gammaproteobacteria bacterium]|nr:DUF938 domain-containing protein [Gammaproteobacteria bacterium]MBU1442990.1 DUF938 domain-containing protein [Gammaproteobacteria bacterium]MBU2285426.1 DUF938 domain-containing protein [Gammaproteobacteria bacterium]MBU2411022.1 DUF938 domain-containing protein [Gammaproteobacteria bacterium]
MDAPRLHSPAAERNRQPILDMLLETLPPHGKALEIASGTGQHVAWFAPAMPGWTWQPSDANAASLPSVDAWAGDAGSGNILPAIELDVMSWPWPVQGPFDAILCANMLHIAPWATCSALMRGAAHALADTGRLIAYGPFLEDGRPTAASNLAFDRDLRMRDPAWGIRSIQAVEAEAASVGLALTRRTDMPANNLALVFERIAA